MSIMDVFKAEYVLSVMGGKRLIWCGRCRGWWAFDAKAGKPYCHGCQLYSDEAAEILRALAARGPTPAGKRKYRAFMANELAGLKRRRKVKPPPLAQGQPSTSPNRLVQVPELKDKKAPRKRRPAPSYRATFKAAKPRKKGRAA